MWWPVNPYSLILLLSLLVAVGTAVVAWRTRPAAGSRSLTALQAAVAVWLGAHVLEIESPSLAAKLFWVDVQWLAAAVIPTCFLVFALEYTGTDRWLSRRRLALLALEPLAMIAVLFVREPLLWGPPYEVAVTLGVSWAPPATVTAADPNVGLLVHFGYATLCLAVSSALVLGVALRNDRLYRWQGLAVFVAIAVPWLTAALSISSLETVGTTPIGFTITGLAITFGLYRYRLLELTPIARHEVVTNLEDGVLVVDDDYQVVDCNPIARELFGPNRESLVGASLDALLPSEIDTGSLLGPAGSDRGSRTADRAGEAVDSGPSGTAAATAGADAQFAVGDGPDRRYYTLSSSPIDDGRGRPVGWTIVVHDVTDRVRRERELERANRKLDEFASVVSHDLRNPLTVSQGYLDLLESEYDPTYVRKVADAHDRMEELIEDVLTLARQGEGALEPEPVALEAVSRTAWETVATPDATLTVADDRRLRADRTRLRQLLENLFRNAVEHGSTTPDSQARQDAVEHGSATPDSGTRRDPVTEAGVGLELTVGRLENGFYVEDTGEGFRSDHDRVFEAGYTTAEEGTGLGLAIVADIVDRHGWSITATDGDRGGARFEITGVEFVDADDAANADADAAVDGSTVDPA